MMILTTDRIRILECSKKIRIDIDVQILVLFDLIIPYHDPILDPHREVIADNGVDDIDEELLWQLEDFFFFFW